MLGLLLRRRIRSKKGLERARKRFVFVLVFISVSSLLLFGLLVYLLHSERINIQDVIVRGNVAVSTESIRRVVNEEIAGAYAYMFPKKSIFLYPKRAIIASIAGAYARIKQIDIESDNFSSLIVSIEERKPYAIWCGVLKHNLVESVMTEEDDNEIKIEDTPATSCFMLDDEGFIYSHAPLGAESLYTVFEGEVSGESAIGTQFIGEEEFKNIAELVSLLQGGGFKPKKVLIENADDFRVYLGSGPQIYFRRGSNFVQALTNFESVVISGEIDKNSLENIEYIDLRFGNRLYVKERE
jgi:cell division septal protein FtsQ